jgi:hypothetical protein
MPPDNPSLHKAIEFLLSRGNLPILYWLKKDILEVPVDREFKNLCNFGARLRILSGQREDGSWPKDRVKAPCLENRPEFLIETLKNAYKLYDYGCRLDNDQVQSSIHYLFSSQTAEGDFRATAFNEYSPGFHALTLEILCRYGLERDVRIQKGFGWILKNRQKDGGWAIPCRTISKDQVEQRYQRPSGNKKRPFKPDRSKPFSHLITGTVLRALAESTTWRGSKECHKAGELVLSRFFQEDRYQDRRSASHWEELTYPFWTTNILSSLDSFSKIGFPAAQPRISQSLEWLLSKQDHRGYWESDATKATLEDHLWMTFAVLRVFRRFEILHV